MTLLSVASHMRTILERETSGRVSFASFVDHYLRVLDFPSDVQDALSLNEINLFEAEQLTRLSSKRLGFTSAQARRKRSDLLNAHIQARLSGARLRQRVEESDPPAKGGGLVNVTTSKVVGLIYLDL
jgi:hypothetical protein